MCSSARPLTADSATNMPGGAQVAGVRRILVLPDNILNAVPLPQFQPMPLGRSHEPFSHPEWLYEIKWDGLRSLAYVHGGDAG